MPAKVTSFTVEGDYEERKKKKYGADAQAGALEQATGNHYGHGESSADAARQRDNAGKIKAIGEGAFRAGGTEKGNNTGMSLADRARKAEEDRKKKKADGN